MPFLVPIKTVAGLNAREHHMARSRRVKAEREAVAWVLKLTKPPRLPVVVTLTREGKRKLDGDNLQGALKAVRDQVAEWLGADDADPRIDWQYAQTIGKEYAVLIEISK